MRRLRTALLVAVVLVGASSIAVIGGGVVLVRTRWGNEWVRTKVQQELQAAVGSRGRVLMGALELRPFGTARLDALEIRDAAGNVVFASGPIDLRYALGPLLDREITVRALVIDRPVVHLTLDSAGTSNVARLFADTATTSTPPSRWRIVVDSLELRDGLASVTQPDSAPTLPPRRAHYRDVGLALGPSRYALGTGTGEFAVRRLTADIEEPAVRLRHAEGRVAVWPDSVRMDLPSIQLPGSRASLAGTVGFASDGDPRLALTLRADTVDLADLAALAPRLPATGSGRAVVRITNGPTAGVIRVAVDSLDAITTASRVRGGLVADLGDALAIRDVDLTAAPLDFALLHALLGDSVPPAPWDGVVRGRLRARGGTLDAWRIDPSVFEFEDRRLGNARSRVTIAGTLDLRAEPVRLRPLLVTIDSLDIRTVGAAVAVADSLDGFLRGSVRLDGPVEDLRFSALELAHHDGALPVTRVRGDGRFQADTSRAWLEARLTLGALSLPALGKAFTAEALNGVLDGTVTATARGSLVGLEVDLAGEGARFTFAGVTSLDSARLLLDGDASVTNLDARRFLPGSTLPDHRISAFALLGIDGTVDAAGGPVVIAVDSASHLGGVTFRDARALLELEPGGVRVDTLAVESALGRLSARGRLSRDPALRDRLAFEASIDSLALARGFLSDSLAEAWRDSLAGRVRMWGMAVGSLDTLDVLAEWEASEIQAGSSSLRAASGSLGLEDVPGASHGLITMTADSVVLSGMPVTRLEAEAMVRDARWADASFRLVAGDTLRASARADLHWLPDSIVMRLDSLDAIAPEARWRLLRPTGLFVSARETRIDTVSLRSDDGGSLDLAMRLDSAGPVLAHLRASRVPIAHARFTGLTPPDINGLVSIDAEVTGTREAPLLAASASLDSVRVDGRPAPGLVVRGDYADRNLDVDLRGRADGGDVFVLTGALPLDLAIAPRTVDQRLVKEPVFIRVVADGSSLEGFEALLPGIAELSGRFDTDMLVGGRWDDLEPRGVLLVRDGGFAVPALGTGFRDLLMDVSFSPDSVIVHRARLADASSPNDSATVEGALARTAAGWRADFTSMARNLRVIDDPRTAEADVSWQLQVRGALDSLTIRGDVLVPRANAYIGAQQRRVLDISEQRLGPDTASVLVPRIEQLRVRLGNEVRLRSREANVQLLGEIAASGPMNDPVFRGEVIAHRGTYRLDLGLLQRTFLVDSGIVRLAGPAKAPHQLDIHSSYIVRQANQEDVEIRARVVGTTHEPRILLSSGALGTTATETEVISYLLFGAPSFALDGERSSALRTASAALVPSLGGAVERALGGRLPFISELRVSTVASDAPVGTTLNSFEGLLNSFALTAGSQLGPDSFLSVSTGVCRGEATAAQSLGVWFGIAAEYRPRERLSAQMSFDPGASPCLRVGTLAQIYQFGLDLFRDWRW